MLNHNIDESVHELGWRLSSARTIMRLSFLATIIALTTSLMSVGVCQKGQDLHQGQRLLHKDLPPYGKLFSIKLSHDASPFGPRSISLTVLKSSILMAMSPNEEPVNLHVTTHRWVLLPLSHWYGC